MFLWIPNTHQKFGNTLKLRKYINALVFLKHVFQKEEQEEKERIEKERLERIELLHQEASAKNLDKTF